jgi:hypothetical protein
MVLSVHIGLVSAGKNTKIVGYLHKKKPRKKRGFVFNIQQDLEFIPE